VGIVVSGVVVASLAVVPSRVVVASAAEASLVAASSWAPGGPPLKSLPPLEPLQAESHAAATHEIPSRVLVEIMPL
jgi:hypothetical protein